MVAMVIEWAEGGGGVVLSTALPMTRPNPADACLQKSLILQFAPMAKDREVISTVKESACPLTVDEL